MSHSLPHDFPESQEDWPATEGNQVLVAMLDELGRILTINGDAKLALATLEAAIERTHTDLAVRQRSA